MKCEGCVIAAEEALRQTCIEPEERDILPSDITERGFVTDGVFLCLHKPTRPLRVHGKPANLARDWWVVFQGIPVSVDGEVFGRAFVSWPRGLLGRNRQEAP